MWCSSAPYSLFLSSFLTALLLLFAPRTTRGQIFTEVGNSFPGLVSGTSAWGDYDNDGRLDLLITGFATNSGFCRVYHNDGEFDGEILFRDIHAGIPDLGGSAAWGDYDNDGDLDILVTGVDSNGFPSTLIIRNDGNRIFTPPSVPLLGLTAGTISWADYDNDGDLDILLFGQN